jgi:hypothetical protein
MERLLHKEEQLTAAATTAASPVPCGRPAGSRQHTIDSSQLLKSENPVQRTIDGKACDFVNPPVQLCLSGSLSGDVQLRLLQQKISTSLERIPPTAVLTSPNSM